MSNIFGHADNAAKREASFVKLDTAVVTTTDTDNTHQVIVRSQRFDEPTACPVLTMGKSDVNVPKEGNVVILGLREGLPPVVLGRLYFDPNEVPDFEEGERIIGHEETDSTIRLKPDGTIHADAEGDVVHNNGTTAPIIDIQTTEDGEGHVTDISVTRASSTKVD